MHICTMSCGLHCNDVGKLPNRVQEITVSIHPMRASMLYCRDQTQLQEELSSLRAASKEADRARQRVSAEGLAAANELEGLRLQLQQQAAASEASRAEVLYLAQLYLSRA